MLASHMQKHFTPPTAHFHRDESCQEQERKQEKAQDMRWHFAKRRLRAGIFKSNFVTQQTATRSHILHATDAAYAERKI